MVSAVDVAPVSVALSAMRVSETLVLVFALLLLASRVSPVPLFVLRGLGVALILMGGSAAGVVLTLAERAVGTQRKLARDFFRAWSLFLMPRVLNITIEYDGGAERARALLESTRAQMPCVYMMNHQSELDLVIQTALMPNECVVLMKKEIADIPFIGHFARLSGDAVFVNRQKHSDAMNALAEAGKIVKERHVSVFVYPEGTRSYQTTNELLPFKKGVFHLAVGAQMPILPIVTESYHSLANFQNLIFNGGNLKIRILDPIPTAGLTSADVTALAESTREVMLKALQEISGPPPKFARPLKIKSPKKKDE